MKYKKKQKFSPVQMFNYVIIFVLTCGASNTLRWMVKDSIVYGYFQPLNALPNPKGHLPTSVSPSAIKDAGVAVGNATGTATPRGEYVKDMAEQQLIAQIFS